MKITVFTLTSPDGLVFTVHSDTQNTVGGFSVEEMQKRECDIFMMNKIVFETISDAVLNVITNDTKQKL